MSRVLRSFLTGFRNSLFAAGRKGHFVGSDQYGNKYFEKIADGKHNLRGSRYIEERSDLKDAFESPTIPVEWEAWLRLKRNDPPTEQEIQRNYARMVQTKLRAAELEKQFKPIENDTNDSALPVVTENITPDSQKSQFPTYEEYENKPGQKYKDKS